jgi:hypothetical protein
MESGMISMIGPVPDKNLFFEAPEFQVTCGQVLILKFHDP